MTISNNFILNEMTTMNYDKFFDNEIGDFILQCLSSASDSDDTLIVQDFNDQQIDFVSGFDQVPTQLLTSSVPVKCLSSMLGNSTIMTSFSNWPMCQSSRNGSSSCEDSSSGRKKVERR